MGAAKNARKVTDIASWQSCAEYYLRDLYPLDRDFVRQFSGRQVTCEMLRELASRDNYGVARSIPGRIEELGVEGKYRPFANMLNKYQTATMTRETVPDIIDREVENMREPYKGNHLWSAISKAFWMMKQHPVVIYDSYADKGLRIEGLRPGDTTYRQYFEAWFQFFERDDTVNALNETVSWAKVSYSSEVHSIPQSWLRNRFADIWLAVRGGAPWTNEVRHCCN